MEKLTLNGEWTLQQVGENDTIPATMPGCVHTDLLAAGEITDPREDRGEPDENIINTQAILENLNGDLELLKDLVRMFLVNLPENMKAISEAANAHNGEALRLAAHTLKGLIGHFVVGPAYEAAHRLEIQGANDDLNGVSEAFTALEKEIERLRPALTELTQTVEGSA